MAHCLLVLEGKCFGNPVSVLVDSGAIDDFVAKHFVDSQTNAPVMTCKPKAVKLADGTKCSVEYVVSAALQLGKLHEARSLLVTELDGYDVILGKPWLTAHNPSIDWIANTVTVNAVAGSEAAPCGGPPRGQPVTLVGKPIPARVFLVSATQLNRELQSSGYECEVWAGTLAEKEACQARGKTTSTSPVVVGALPVIRKPARTASEVWTGTLAEKEACQARGKTKSAPPLVAVPPVSSDQLGVLMTQFADVFAPLPAGLPPARAVDHAIALEPGATPTWRPTYRMSPAELLEVRKQLDDLLAKEFIQPSISPYGYYRRFIQDFSRLAAPLTELTRKDTNFYWSSEHAAAFNALKAFIQTAPVLATPDPTKPFILYTDASILATRAVLLQLDNDNKPRPLAFLSHKLLPAERNYTVGELELLAIIHALRAWRCFLEGTDFVVYTDHLNLATMMKAPTLNGRQARWATFLQQFLPGMEIKYKRGADNLADPLSRRPDYAATAAAAAPASGDDTNTAYPSGCSQDWAKSGFPIPATGNAPCGAREESTCGAAGEPSYGDNVHAEPAAAATTAAPPAAAAPSTQLATAATKLHAVETSIVSVELEQQLQAAYNENPDYIESVRDEDFYLLHGLWYRGPRLVIPPCLQRSIFDEHHCTKYAGHLGRDKTRAAIAATCWWPSLAADVGDWCKTCPECQKNKPGNQAPAGLLRPLPIPSYPWESMSMDLMTDLPTTAEGHDSIVVFCCRLTKMLHFVPCCKTVTAPQLASLFVQHVFRAHGLPKNIVSDRDPRFTLHFWKTVFTLLGTTLNMSTAFHPQTDGPSERAFRTLQQMLRSYVSPRQNDWEECVPLLEFAYNNSKQASTGFSPFVLCYGRAPATPFLSFLAFFRLCACS